MTTTSGIPTSAGVAPLSEPASSLDARVRELAAVAPVSAPGAAYHYSNANYVVLGRLVEVVSGRPFEAYLQDHVFEPLGMHHASADPATSAADGLGDAHRLWFGLADTHRPLDRADLAPAGFVSASADDLGRYLAALMEPAGPDGGRVASAATVAAMFAGTAPTGIGDERYGLGWAETTYRGERMVAHAGSTTDMASFVAILPRARPRDRGACSTPRARSTSSSTSRTRSAWASSRWRWARRPTARWRASIRSWTSRSSSSSASWHGGSSSSSGPRGPHAVAP